MWSLRYSRNTNGGLKSMVCVLAEKYHELLFWHSYFLVLVHILLMLIDEIPPIHGNVGKIKIIKWVTHKAKNINWKISPSFLDYDFPTFLVEKCIFAFYATIILIDRFVCVLFSIPMWYNKRLVFLCYPFNALRVLSPLLPPNRRFWDQLLLVSLKGFMVSQVSLESSTNNVKWVPSYR